MSTLQWGRIFVIAVAIATPSACAKSGPQEAPPATSAARPEIVAEEAPAEPEPSPAPKPSGRVARALITLTVVDREPGEAVRTLPADAREVFFFTELRGLEGRRVTHRWEHAGTVVAEVPIEIGGPRWRAYSKKTLPASRRGEWKVSLIDSDGGVMLSESFTYQRPTD